MANCSQIDNITIIGTSVTSYDSTPLPCLNVKQCDGLNDILNKFNSIICEAQQITNILSEEITNATEDVMIIKEDIHTIHTQVSVCCPICNFTGTAIQLPAIR